MSPALGTVLMMNNYFHDVATALLIASGAAIWIISRKLGNAPDQGMIDYFLRVYASMARLAKFSLAWIVIGGIPRVLAYRDFEWANAAGKGQVPALIVKHILAFTFVCIGARLWIRINRRIKDLKSQGFEPIPTPTLPMINSPHPCPSPLGEREKGEGPHHRRENFSSSPFKGEVRRGMGYKENG